MDVGFAAVEHVLGEVHAELALGVDQCIRARRAAPAEFACGRQRAAGGALSPAGEFGWGGAAGAYTLIDPERQLSVYFAEHMLNSCEPYVHPRLRNLLYAAL